MLIFSCFIIQGIRLFSLNVQQHNCHKGTLNILILQLLVLFLSVLYKSVRGGECRRCSHRRLAMNPTMLLFEPFETRILGFHPIIHTHFVL